VTEDNDTSRGVETHTVEEKISLAEEKFENFRGKAGLFFGSCSFYFGFNIAFSCSKLICSQAPCCFSSGHNFLHNRGYSNFRFDLKNKKWAIIRLRRIRPVGRSYGNKNL